jgi:hypothetical protein
VASSSPTCAVDDGGLTYTGQINTSSVMQRYLSVCKQAPIHCVSKSVYMAIAPFAGGSLSQRTDEERLQACCSRGSADDGAAAASPAAAAMVPSSNTRMYSHSVGLICSQIDQSNATLNRPFLETSVYVSADQARARLTHYIRNHVVRMTRQTPCAKFQYFHFQPYSRERSSRIIQF